MIKRLIKKLDAGTMAYAYDSEGIQLRQDFPKKGKQGARFDDATIISFNSIREKLLHADVIRTDCFSSLFKRHSGNNGPMLTAALCDLGILLRVSRGKYRVSHDFLQV